MIILAILGSVAAIGMLCWLLFTLAVFALPAFVGVTAGVWAHGTGAGISGAILVGAVAAAITLAATHLLITLARPMWLKLIVAAAFVVPAAVAGFHATHGLVKHLMPSDAWQIAFSVSARSRLASPPSCGSRVWERRPRARLAVISRAPDLRHRRWKGQISG